MYRILIAVLVLLPVVVAAQSPPQQQSQDIILMPRGLIDMAIEAIRHPAASRENAIDVWIALQACEASNSHNIGHTDQCPTVTTAVEARDKELSATKEHAK